MGWWPRPGAGTEPPARTRPTRTRWGRRPQWKPRPTAGDLVIGEYQRPHLERRAPAHLRARTGDRHQPSRTSAPDHAAPPTLPEHRHRRDGRAARLDPHPSGPRGSRPGPPGTSRRPGRPARTGPVHRPATSTISSRSGASFARSPAGAAADQAAPDSEALTPGTRVPLVPALACRRWPHVPGMAGRSAWRAPGNLVGR